MKIESKFSVGNKVKVKVKGSEGKILGAIKETKLINSYFEHLVEFVDKDKWIPEEDLEKADMFSNFTYSDGKSEDEHIEMEEKEEREGIVNHMNEWRKHFHMKFKDNEAFWEVYNEEFRRTLEGNPSEIKHTPKYNSFNWQFPLGSVITGEDLCIKQK